MKIYCKKKLSKRSKKEFLLQYFESRTPTTYFLGTNKMQCSANRNRSIGDLKALLDGSFKTITSKNKTIMLLMSLFEESKIKALKCPNIGKIVFFNKRKGCWTYSFNIHEFFNRFNGDDEDSEGISFNELIEYYNKNKKK